MIMDGMGILYLTLALAPVFLFEPAVVHFHLLRCNCLLAVI